MLYRADLAYIHHHGFSEFAESAAPGVIAMLRRAAIPRNAGDLRSAGIPAGRSAGFQPASLIVEAGCGSGILARALTEAGYDVLGFDASAAMLRLARRTAPRARFKRAPFDAMKIPPCDAIVAMGEVLNYGTMEGVQSFVANAARALREGGVLLFDVAEGGAYPAYDERRVGGDDWSVIAIKESDGVHLTRRVLTFRKVRNKVQRDEEVHTLALYDRDALLELLRAHDFRVHVRRSYGTRRLPPGHFVYLCTLAREPRASTAPPPTPATTPRAARS